MSEFDSPKSSVETGPNTGKMMSCPKCGFVQPVDPYCASCGIDMAQAPKPPAPLSKRPVLLLTIAAVSIFTAILIARNSRQSASDGSAEGTVASRISAGISARISAATKEVRANSELSAKNVNVGNPALNQAEVEVQDSETNDARPTLPSEAGIPGAPLTAEALPTPGASPGAKPPSDAKATPPDEGLLVGFVWTEVSREWLLAFGALEPGIHRIPDLDARLRESKGGYRIVEATRHQLSEKPEPLQLTYRERIAVRFDATAANPTILTGALQISLRALDGRQRPTSTAPIELDKNQGAIVTFGVPIAAATSPGSLQAEIVVLILPRWSAERNP